MRYPRAFSLAVLVAACIPATVLSAQNLPELFRFDADKKSAGTYEAGDDQQAQVIMEDGTDLRLGERTSVEKKAGKRFFDLGRGAMMIGVSKGVFKRPAKINVAESEITLKGTTAIVEYVKDTYIKIICIEGQLRVALKALVGEWISVNSGQMLIINPVDVRLPDPVEVDIEWLLATSAFANGNFNGPPNPGLVADAIAAQAQRIEEGELLRTELIIPSRGTRVTLTTDGNRNTLPDRTLVPPDPPVVVPAPMVAVEEESVRRTAGPGVAPPPPIIIPESEFPDFPFGTYIIDETTVFSDGSLQTPGFEEITATREDVDMSVFDTFSFPLVAGSQDDLLFTGVIDFMNPGDLTGAIFQTQEGIGLSSGEISPSPDTPDFEFSAGGPISFNDFNVARVDRVTVESDQSIDVQNSILAGDISLDLFTSNGPVSLSDSDLSAQEITVGSFGTGSSVSLSGSQVQATLEVEIGVDNGQVMVDNSTVTAGNPTGSGTVSLTSTSTSTAGTGIVVRNTSELRALGAMSALRLETNGAGIQVTDSVLESSGEILIDTVNGAVDSMVELRNVMLMADTIRARSAGANGELLINGSTFDANSLIRLYAGGANGVLRFTGGNSSLTATVIDLAGRTVQVDNGVEVTTGASDFRIFTDNPNFNQTGFGDFVGSPPSVDTFDSAAKPAFR